MNFLDKIYEPKVTIVYEYSNESYVNDVLISGSHEKVTIVQGERCLFLRIETSNKEVAVLKNSQGNEARISFKAFEKLFYPSKDQESEL